MRYDYVKKWSYGIKIGNFESSLALEGRPSKVGKDIGMLLNVYLKMKYKQSAYRIGDILVKFAK